MLTCVTRPLFHEGHRGRERESKHESKRVCGEGFVRGYVRSGAGDVASISVPPTVGLALPLPVQVEAAVRADRGG